MGKKIGCLWIAALCAMSACSQPETKLTEIVVEVDADEDVAENLTRVDIAIYDPKATARDGHAEPASRQRLVVNSEEATSGTVTFPFSVGIRKAKSERFLLVVTGYAGNEPVIEQKVFATFHDGQLRGLGIYLASPCLEQLCDGVEASTWLTRTCNTRSGECGEVETRDTVPVRKGEELDAGLVTREPRTMDAEPDANDGGAPDAAPDPDSSMPDAGPPSPPSVDYALGMAGQPCAANQNQMLACEGHASRKVLKCNNRIWELFNTCAETARCDSRSGIGQGVCVSIPTPCIGRAPGDLCEGTVRKTCGPDLVSLSDSPCATNTHCEDRNGATCVCNTGYESDGQGGCTNPDDCPRNACTGGRCVDGLSDFSCDCNSGFAGTGQKECTAVTYCPKDACTPGGTCIDVRDWRCQCGPGFSGSGSQACTNVNDCPSNRCSAPGGTCQDGVNTYTCNCNPGFSGTDCQTDVCNPNPCANGGSCSRTGTLCSCPQGFGGTHCQIDTCNPNPCQHGGICTRTTQGASCNCGASGYVGVHCETSSACAAPNLCTSPDYPCASSGTGYTCQGQFADWHMPDGLAGSKFAPSYSTSTPGIVIDNVTGLIWQAAIDVSSYAWPDAKSYCDGLTLAGQSDWRLPSKIELESIVDETQAGPAIAGAFLGTPGVAHWTSSPYVGSPGNAWLVNFNDGYSTYTVTTSVARVRCVRGSSSQAATPADRYVVDTTANTVTDTRTGLIWQRTIRTGSFTWDSARTQCSGGFRLPALKELLTIVDPTRTNPSIDPRFRGETESQDTPGAGFWLASPYLGASAAWTLTFDGGSSASDSTTVTNRVRCVR